MGLALFVSLTYESHPQTGLIPERGLNVAQFVGLIQFVGLAKFVIPTYIFLCFVLLLIINQYIYPTKKKERHIVRFVNYNQLRIVDKILIFERNCLKFLSVIDKYPGYQ